MILWKVCPLPLSLFLPQIDFFAFFAASNRWDSLDQEILISTPRRFGKTISVSMFAAALIFSCPNVECSIYSTCKRISQKLLRNIYKFLELIYAELGVAHYRIIRHNMEEIVLRGPESDTDVRVVNSYPSKVKLHSFDVKLYFFDVNFIPVCEGVLPTSI